MAGASTEAWTCPYCEAGLSVETIDVEVGPEGLVIALVARCWVCDAWWVPPTEGSASHGNRYGPII